MSGAFSIWTVYNRPRDYPDHVVARRFEVHGGGRVVATADVHLANTLEGVRLYLAAMGLVRMPRDPEDDPCVVESWL